VGYRARVQVGSGDFAGGVDADAAGSANQRARGCAGDGEIGDYALRRAHETVRQTAGIEVGSRDIAAVLMRGRRFPGRKRSAFAASVSNDGHASALAPGASKLVMCRYPNAHSRDRRCSNLSRIP